MGRDDRRNDELRPVRIEPGYNRYAEGSALLENGLTRVLCTASVEERVPDWTRGKGQGWVTAEYSMLPRATNTRGVREVTRGRPSGRTTEIQRLLGRAFRAALDLKALGERTLWVDCDVLQADGGTRAASVTGGMVAVALACRKLVDAGLLARMPIRRLVAAVSAGRIDGQDRLDLSYDEDSRADLDLAVVWSSDGRLVEVQGGAEGEPFEEEDLRRLLALSRSGAERLFSVQRSVLKGVLED